MYVWFDALVSYLSTLNWPEPQQPWENFWPGVQICGKDNLRQQAAMWQAMLLSAGIPLSKQILVNGFITVDGEKMSKSVGNVIAPQDLINRYGKDASRCIIASLPTFSDDVDITTSHHSYLLLKLKSIHLHSPTSLIGDQSISNNYSSLPH